MVSDSKKVQTFINRLANSVQEMRDQMVKINNMKQKFVTANPDVSGTPLDGNVIALNNNLSQLETELSRGIWTTLINAKQPSHRGEAL